jgi:hypothetical protein
MANRATFGWLTDRDIERIWDPETELQQVIGMIVEAESLIWELDAMDCPVDDRKD